MPKDSELNKIKTKVHAAFAELEKEGLLTKKAVAKLPKEFEQSLKPGTRFAYYTKAAEEQFGDDLTFGVFCGEIVQQDSTDLSLEASDKNNDKATEKVAELVKSVMKKQGLYVDPELSIGFHVVVKSRDTEAEAEASACPEWHKLRPKVNQVFDKLKKQGIRAEDNFSCCMSDALVEIGDENYKGYAFYHEQDTERGRKTGSLHIAFGTMKGDASQAEQKVIGKKVKQALEDDDLAVEWNGDVQTRLLVTLKDTKQG